jgi:hypothetical protein
MNSFKIKIVFGIFSLFCETLTIYAQSRLVLNSNPYLVIANNAYLVIDNPNTNAITELPTLGNGNIITESEFNMVKWNIATNTGTYRVPFTKNVANQIPFEMTLNTAGIGSGTILFSTYPGPTWDNQTYMPSDVTNMSSVIGGPNNSANVIDRFWIIDAQSYSTKPAASFAFTYLDAEHSAVGNTIIESELGAQRWSGTTWDAYIPQGSINTSTNVVSAVPVANADFFRSWTLSTTSSPLPIELLHFTAKCNNSFVKIEWVTASEINNNYFALEKSNDGINYYAIATMAGAGNSTNMLNYTYNDKVLDNQISYYRLKQTDYNGITKTYNPISVNCNYGINNILAFNNQMGNLIVAISDNTKNNYKATIYNSLGSLVANKAIVSENGKTNTAFDISTLSVGVYFITIENGEKIYTQKFYVNQ